MPRARHRIMRIACLACIATGMAALPAAAARATPAAGHHTSSTPARSSPADMSGQAWARRQLPLLKAANEILQFTGQGTKAGDTSYADVTISVPNRLVTLYWHGTVPRALRDRLARLRVPVRIVAAPYTWQQLERQASRIADARTSLGAAGYTLSRVGPDAAATGLTVGIDFTRSRALAAPAGNPSAASTAAAARAKATRAKAAVERLVPGLAPVTVSDAPLARASGSRQLDNLPFWGGSRIVRDGNVVCTSGFSVIKGSTRYMVTAGHCGGISTVWQTGHFYGAGLTLGTEVARNPCCDSAIISVSDNQGFIYDKGYNSSTGEAVIGARTASPPSPITAVGGTAICTEGATSGVRCNIQTLATGQFFSFTNPSFTAENESLGMQMTAGQEAAAQGDSGGPVIINSGTAGKVYATGTISGISGTVACPGNIDPNVVPGCGTEVAFEEIIPILNLWGVNLVTAG
jgi:hypothetical protein